MNKDNPMDDVFNDNQMDGVPPDLAATITDLTDEDEVIDHLVNGSKQSEFDDIESEFDQQFDTVEEEPETGANLNDELGGELEEGKPLENTEADNSSDDLFSGLFDDAIDSETNASEEKAVEHDDFVFGDIDDGKSEFEQNTGEGDAVESLREEIEHADETSSADVDYDDEDSIKDKAISWLKANMMMFIVGVLCFVYVVALFTKDTEIASDGYAADELGEFVGEEFYEEPETTQSRYTELGRESETKTGTNAGIAEQQQKQPGGIEEAVQPEKQVSSASTSENGQKQVSEPESTQHFSETVISESAVATVDQQNSETTISEPESFEPAQPVFRDVPPPPADARITTVIQQEPQQPISAGRSLETSQPLFSDAPPRPVDHQVASAALKQPQVAQPVQSHELASYQVRPTVANDVSKNTEAIKLVTASMIKSNKMAEQNHEVVMAAIDALSQQMKMVTANQEKVESRIIASEQQIKKLQTRLKNIASVAPARNKATHQQQKVAPKIAYKILSTSGDKRIAYVVSNSTGAPVKLQEGSVLKGYGRITAIKDNYIIETVTGRVKRK